MPLEYSKLEPARRAKCTLNKLDVLLGAVDGKLNSVGEPQVPLKDCNRLGKAIIASWS